MRLIFQPAEEGGAGAMNLYIEGNESERTGGIDQIVSSYLASG